MHGQRKLTHPCRGIKNRERGADVAKQQQETAKERRRHVRVDSANGVRYRILAEKVFKESEDKRPHSASDKNISGGGILIETDEDVPMGALIGLEVKLKKVEFPLFVVGEVVRKEGPDENGKYGVGVKFVRVSENDTLEIFNYMVEKVMKEVEG